MNKLILLLCLIILLPLPAFAHDEFIDEDVLEDEDEYENKNYFDEFSGKTLEEIMEEIRNMDSYGEPSVPKEVLENWKIWHNKEPDEEIPFVNKISNFFVNNLTITVMLIIACVIVLLWIVWIICYRCFKYEIRLFWNIALILMIILTVIYISIEIKIIFKEFAEVIFFNSFDKPVGVIKCIGLFIQYILANPHHPVPALLRMLIAIVVSIIGWIIFFLIMFRKYYKEIEGCE